MKRGEWAGAETIDRFVSTGTEDPAKPATKAWLAVDERNLYVAMRCELVNGQEPKFEERKRDGRVYLDDAIEVFVRPDPSKPFYYQCIANCAGSVFDSRYTIVKPGDIRSDLKWNGVYRIKTGREKDAWTIEIAFSLNSLGIVPEGVQPIRLNITRDIIDGTKKIATWSYLGVASSSIHIRPDEYGIGFCTFKAKRGEWFKLSELKNRVNSVQLSVDKQDVASFLPEGHKARVHLTLPGDCHIDEPLWLIASVRSVDRRGRMGQAVSAGKLQLTNQQPAYLNIRGLEPGDYDLTVSLSGMGISTNSIQYLQVRVPEYSPQIEGKPVIDDSNWKSADSVASSTGIEHTVITQLLLKNQFAKPVLVNDPTTDETITCLTDFNDKLYIGTCTKPAVTDTGTVLTYDPVTDALEKSFQVNEQGLVQMVVDGDKLYIPGYDANDGEWDLGNIYIHDGKNWIERRTVPGAIHIYGLAVYRGRIYISGDILGPGPKDPIEYTKAGDRGELECYGRVMSSGDGGLTWREEYRGKNQGQDIGYMTVFKDKLIVNSAGDLVVFDGKKWTPMELNPAVLFVYDYQQVGDLLFVGTPFGLFYFDSSRLWKSPIGVGTLRDMTAYGDNLLMASYWTDTSMGSHGPGGGRYPDISARKPDYYSFMLNAKENAWEQMAGGKIDERKFLNRLTQITGKDIFASCHTFRGRVYIGTHPEGKLMVLPVSAVGSLISTPRKIENSEGSYRLWWKGTTPPGTAIEVQIRYAENERELEKKPFVGPDGTVKKVFSAYGEEFRIQGADNKGALRFLQYRVVMRTKDPALTPYLDRVVITESNP